MKSVGITGPPGSGKSTLFKAITAGHSSGEVAAIPVPDERLDVLVKLHSSKSRVPAQLQVIDIHAAARSAGAAIAKLRETDAVLLVVPKFTGSDPEAIINSARDEHILADMGPFDTRLNRAKKDAASKADVPALEAAMAHLESGKFLRDGDWQSDELKVFSALGPITLKPHIVVINVDESELQSDPPELGFPVFAANASLEAEVAGLNANEAAELLKAYGVSQSVLGRVISEVYKTLDLITFYTTAEKESRAWEVRRGALAPEAAGVIHSDLQRGFIRAEVVHYDVLVEAGSWDAAKAKGQIRVEGKDYPFKEGDVTHFRFAV